VKKHCEEKKIIMKKFPMMLAWRYLWSANREPSIATMMRICFLGIFLGTVSLTLVVCIMQGFEISTKQKLQNIHPMVMIRSDAPLNYKKIATVLKKEFPEITGSAPSAQQYVIIKDQDQHSLNNVIMLKGIDPQQETGVTAIEQKIVYPRTSSLNKLLNHNHILIGKKLADQLELERGDVITLLYVPEKHKNKLKEVNFIINGLFNTGIEEFDTTLGLIALDSFNELFPEKGISEIGLKINPQSKEQKIIKQLRTRFDLEVVSWHELYPALVSALKLEKYTMFFIIALITLVASMNIISLLFMQITQKRGNIAILKACGLPFNKLRSIFLWIGLFIGFGGTLTGLATAYFIGLLLKTFPFIQLPDVYYTSHLPIVLDPFVFFIVFITVITLVFLSTAIPLRTIKKINIADVLRFEG